MTGRRINKVRNPSKKHNDFWKWFGRSKVVDENNEPLIVYHGTRATEMFDTFMYGKFDIYDDKDIKFSNDLNSFLGPHFTESSLVASKIAMGDYHWTDIHESSLGAVIPVYLRIENPLIFDHDSGEEMDSELMLKEEIMILGSGTKEERKIINDQIHKLLKEDEDDEIDLLELREEINNSVDERLNILSIAKNKSEVMAAIAKEARFMIKDQGYDGIFYRNSVEGGGMSFIPFSEKQIWWILKRNIP